MRALIAPLIAAGVVLGAYRFFFARSPRWDRGSQPGGAASMPAQAVPITGVKNDLVAMQIRQAE